MLSYNKKGGVQKVLSIFGQARYNKRGPVCFYTLRDPTHELDCHSAKEFAMKVFAGGRH